MTESLTAECPVPGCGNLMPGRYAVCSKHFGMLGRGLRARIREVYRHPTPTFGALVQEAIEKALAAERATAAVAVRVEEAFERTEGMSFTDVTSVIIEGVRGR